VSPRKARRLPDDVPRRLRRAGRTISPGQRDKATDEETASHGLQVGPARIEDWPDGSWMVRNVAGSAEAKTYRCPGCDQEIKPGTAHVVVWPEETPGLTERRHWHNACWRRRPRRPGPARFR
jgi:hypothetical protein